MPSENQYEERTPDLITKIRMMREAAEKEMDRFTCVADYDVRRVVGQKPNVAPDASASAAPAAAGSNSAKPSASLRKRQSAIQFPASPLADIADKEGA